MNFVKENTEKNTVKFTITLNAEEWEAANAQAYEKNKSKFSIQGFRKGKVPRKVLENAYGVGFLYEEAINEALPIYYGKALDESKDVEPVDRPDIDITDIAPDKLVFTATVTVKPEVKLGDYKGLEIKKISYSVTEKDVKKEIDAALEKAGRLVDVTDRAVEKGDSVVIDYSGSVDGVKFEGGTAEKQNLEIGSGMFIPGFEDQIIGMNIGEDKTISVKFPENYGAENLAGKDAQFAIHLHEIKKKELPALDDEFAKDVSEFDTLEDYKADIKKKLKENNAKRAETEMENNLIEAVVSNVTVDIPECMIDQQSDDMLQQFEYRLMYQGLKMDDYLKYTGTTIDEIKKQYHDDAAKAVKTRLAMEALIEAEKIEVTEDQIDERLKKFAENSKKSFEDYKKSAQGKQLDYIKNDILYENLIAFLKKENKFVK